MIDMIRRSGFFLSALAISCILALAVMAIDRSTVKYLSVLGDLNEKQLLSIKSELATFKGSPRDVVEVKTQLESLEWVHHVNVMKDWPSGLVVEVFPQQVIAYWNDDGAGTRTRAWRFRIPEPSTHLARERRWSETRC